jgi:hypothetical protein
MPRDPLTIALHLRKTALEEARRDLAACLQRESEAESAAVAAEAEIFRQIEAASALTADDHAVDVLAKWLPGGRAAAAAARRRQQEESTRTSLARAGLTAARAATEAIESLVEAREAQRRAAEARTSLNELNEAALTRGAADDDAGL